MNRKLRRVITTARARAILASAAITIAAAGSAWPRNDVELVQPSGNTINLTIHGFVALP